MVGSYAKTEPTMVCEKLQARFATAEHPGELLGTVTELKVHQFLFLSYQLGSHFDEAVS